jgi:hypothetical protein
MGQQPHTQGVRMPLAGGERGGGLSSGSEACASSVCHSPEGVELQHGAAATCARCAYATRRRRRWRHTCTCAPLEYVTYVDRQHAAARGSSSTGVVRRGRHSTPRVYATRGYVTRVRIRHPCTCTPLEYKPLVEQHFLLLPSLTSTPRRSYITVGGKGRRSARHMEWLHAAACKPPHEAWKSDV